MEHTFEVYAGNGSCGTERLTWNGELDDWLSPVNICLVKFGSLNQMWLMWFKVIVVLLF